MSVLQRVGNKVHAARALAQFMRYFRNWRDVWSAYRASQPLPPLVLKDGITLYHDEKHDDPIALFREVFVAEPYTRGGFYRPAAGDMVLDLGGNIGFFAMYLQWCARGIRIHSFEPAGGTFERFSRNVRENGLDDLITVHRCAVSDQNGTVTLKHADLSTHRSLFDSQWAAESKGAGQETVECVTLDRATASCGGGPIDLLKVDIEGAEIEALEGAGSESLGRVRRIAVEYHDVHRPGCRERVTRVLASQGFTSIETFPDEYNDGQFGTIRAIGPSSR